MQRTRAWRRAQRERIKQKRSRQIATWGFHNRAMYDPVFLGIMVKTPCRCSCVSCGNPRRHYGEVTRQEKINREREVTWQN